MKALVLLAGLLVVGSAAAASTEDCKQIKFADGRKIVMHAAFVESRNVSTELSWGTKVFSVNVRPPVGEQFADVLAIIVEPDGGMSAKRREACAADSGARSCSTYVTPSDVAVTIFYWSRGIASRDSLAAEVREYVDKQVLTCL